MYRYCTLTQENGAFIGRMYEDDYCICVSQYRTIEVAMADLSTWSNRIRVINNDNLLLTWWGV